jgi:hypothetical protein
MWDKKKADSFWENIPEPDIFENLRKISTDICGNQAKFFSSYLKNISRKVPQSITQRLAEIVKLERL